MQDVEQSRIFYQEDLYPENDVPDFDAIVRAEILNALGLPAEVFNTPDPSNASLVRRLDNRYSQTWLSVYPVGGPFVIPLAMYELRHCHWHDITYGFTPQAFPFFD